MSLRQGARPGSVPVWKLRRWLPAVLAAAAGLGGPATWALAQPAPQMQPPNWQPVANQPPIGGLTPQNVEPRPTDKKVEQSGTKEKTVTVNHDKADWNTVLDWYAAESGLVPVLTVKPTGPVTIRGKDQKYTIAEVTDLLNEAMIPNKFILVRQSKTFTIIPVDDKVNWSLVPTITPDELKVRGKTELVVVTLQLKTLNVDDAAPELEKMLTPFGKLVAFRSTNSVQIGDTSGNIARIKKVIDEIEGSNEDTLTHHCKFKKAREVAEVLKTLLTDANTKVETPNAQMAPGGYGYGYGYDPRFGGGDPRFGGGDRRRDDSRSGSQGGTTGRVKSVQISVDESTNSVLLTAPPDKVQLARKIIDDLDKPKFPGDKPITITTPQMRYYSVPAGTADIVAKTLQAKHPSLTIQAVPSTNQVIVYGTDDEQKVVSEQINGGGASTGGSETVIFLLRLNEPKEVAATAVKLFPAMGAPVIEPRSDGSILVSGTADQITKVKTYLRAIGEQPDGVAGGGPLGNPPLGGGPTSRSITIETGNASVLANGIADGMKRMGKNPVYVRNLTGPNITAPDPRGPSPFGQPPTSDPRFPNPNPTTDPRIGPNPNGPPPNPNGPTPNGPTPNDPVPKMLPPTPLPNSGGPRSEAPRPQPQEQLDPRFASAQISDPDQKNGQKPVVITVIGNKLLIESEDPAAVQLVTELIRYYTRVPLTTEESLFEVIRLKYISAEDAAKVISEVFNGPAPTQQNQGGGLLGNLNPLGGLLGRFGGGGGAAPTNPTPGRVRVVAEKSSNSLIVMKASPVDLLTIKELLKNVIDTGQSDAVTQKTYIIPVNNVSASEMAQVIKDVYKSSMGSTGGGGGIQGGLPGLFLGGGGGNRGGGNQSSAQPAALTIGVDERTNSLVVMCSEQLYQDIRLLVWTLDRTPAQTPDSPETVRIVQLKGLDPYLVQQTVDAMQGTDPNSRIQQQQRMQGGGGLGGGNRGGGQFGGGQFGGGQFGGGNRGGGIAPGGFQGGGNRGGGLAPGGGGGNRGGGGGGNRGGGRTASLDGTEGPLNFDYRGMDAPSAPVSTLIYDPETDDRRSPVSFQRPAPGGVIQAGGQYPGPGLPMGGPLAAAQPGGIQPPMGMGPQQPMGGPLQPPAGLPITDDPFPDVIAPRGTITLYPLPSNPEILVIRSTNPDDMDQLLRLIRILQDQLKDQEPEVRAIPLQYADCNTIANTLNTIFSRVQVGAGGTNFVSPQARTQGGAIGGTTGNTSVYVYAQPRSNSLLVAAPRSRFLDIIREVQKYDQPNTTKPKAFKLQKASAQIVALQLQQLYTQRWPGEVAQNMAVRIGFDLPSNSVLVQAGGADLMDIEYLITYLDTNVSNAVNEVRVFRLKNALADELSQVLVQSLTSNTVNPLQQATSPWYLQGQNTAGGAAGLGAFGGAGGGLGGGGLGGGLGGGGLGGGGLGQQGGGGLGGQQGRQLGGGGLGGGFGQQTGGGIGGAGVSQQASGVAPTVGQATGGGFATKTMALRYFSAKGGDVVETGLLSDVHIIPNARLNSLVVAAPEQTMKLLAKLIDDLDVVSAARAYINVFKLEKADATLTAALLQQLFTGQTTGAAGGAGGFQGAAAQGGLNQNTGTRPLLTLSGSPSDGATLIDLRISVDDRTNSLIVAGALNDLDTIRAIIGRLEGADVPTRYNEVYKLRNAAAADVATTLQTFITNTLNVYSGASFLSAYQQLQRNVVIVAEPVSNTIMISATPQYFNEIKRLIERIDAQPPQVVIKVLIAEVQLNNNQEFGVEAGIQSPVLFARSLVPTTDTATGIQNVGIPGFNFNTVAVPLPNSALAQQGTVGFQGLSNLGMGRSSSLGFGGFVFSAASDSFNLLIRALQAQGRVEILSAPMVQVTDNQTGFVQVGQNFPTLTNTVLGVGQSQQGIEYQQIGITMRVTPRVNPDGKVLMRVEPQISTPTPQPINLGNGTFAPAFNVQTVQTTVLASDGETVVLGGLITKTESRTENGIPFFKDIPYVGSLFRYRSQAIQRREVLIIMTPQIVRSEFDNAKILAEESRRMHWCVPHVASIHGHGMDVIGPAMQGANPVPVGPGGQLAPGTYQPGPVYIQPGDQIPGGPVQLPAGQPMTNPMPVMQPVSARPGAGVPGVPVQPTTSGAFLLPGPVPVGGVIGMPNMPAAVPVAQPVAQATGTGPTYVMSAPAGAGTAPTYTMVPAGGAPVGTTPVLYAPVNAVVPTAAVGPVYTPAAALQGNPARGFMMAPAPNQNPVPTPAPNQNPVPAAGAPRPTSNPNPTAMEGPQWNVFGR